MRIIKPPQKVIYDLQREHFLFLAGSIEMGIAEPWQTQVEQALRHTNWTILNPRRDHWDASWKQEMSDERFVEQVEWELDCLSMANKILMYFDPATKSPITLLELGLYACNGEEKLIVCCPQGFWRRGNVEIVCRKYGVPFFDNLQDGLGKLI